MICEGEGEGGGKQRDILLASENIQISVICLITETEPELQLTADGTGLSRLGRNNCLFSINRWYLGL